MAKNAVRSHPEKDSALPQVRRARRRLIGAAALAIAAAVVLTLMLDSEPRGTLRDIEVTIPSRVDPDVAGTPPSPPPLALDSSRDITDESAPARAVPEPALAMPAEDTAGAAPEERPAPEPDSEESVAAESPPPAVSETPSASEAPPDAQPARGSGSAAKRPAPGSGALASAASSKTSDKATGRASDRTTGKASGAAESKAAGGAAGRAPGAAGNAGGFSVQVGAFSTEEAAQAQVRRVRETGLPVYTETISTAQGTRIRVRAGPFGSHGEAERANARLKLAGVESAIIKP